MGYCAATGELDPAEIEERAFYAEQFLVDESNAADFAEPAADLAEFECDSLFERSTGPVTP